MRNLDFAPLYRATVGFDRIADLMDRVLTTDVAQPTYPPYNIEKTAEDAYRISIAVAGFTPDDLSVEVKDGNLHVTAGKAADETEHSYLHRGIAARGFIRSFVLAPQSSATSLADALWAPLASPSAALPWPTMSASRGPCMNTGCSTSTSSAKCPRR